MKRRVFNTLAVVSLLICVADIGLSIRGKYRCDSIHWDTDTFGKNGQNISHGHGFVILDREGICAFGPTPPDFHLDFRPRFPSWKATHHALVIAMATLPILSIGIRPRRPSAPIRSRVIGALTVTAMVVCLADLGLWVRGRFLGRLGTDIFIWYSSDYSAHRREAMIFVGREGISAFGPPTATQGLEHLYNVGYGSIAIADCASQIPPFSARLLYSLWLRPPRHARPLPGVWDGGEQGGGCIVKRRLFNALTVVLLVLCLVTFALCVRGFWQADTFALGKWWRDGTQMFNRCYYPESSWQSIGIVYRTEIAFLTPVEQESLKTTPWTLTHGTNKPPSLSVWFNGPRGRWMRWLGFYAYRNQSTSQGDSVHGRVMVDDIYVGVPSALVLTILALMPAWRLWKRFRFVRPGVCRVCGYDLRATPDRCPECGTIARVRR